MTNHIPSASMSTPAPGALATAQPAADSGAAELRSREDTNADPIEQIAFELAFELEEAELSPDDYVTVNREKLRAIAERVYTRSVNSHDRLKQDCANLLAAKNTLLDLLMEAYTSLPPGQAIDKVRKKLQQEGVFDDPQDFAGD